MFGMKSKECILTAKRNLLQQAEKALPPNISRESNVGTHIILQNAKAIMAARTKRVEDWLTHRYQVGPRPVNQTEARARAQMNTCDQQIRILSIFRS